MFTDTFQIKKYQGLVSNKNICRMYDRYFCAIQKTSDN